MTPAVDILRGRGALYLLLTALAWGAASSALHAEPLSPHAKVQFDIPAQPLAEALVAYGATTGVEVFYDGSLALGQRSTAIKGEFAPIGALEAILRGTGYVPKASRYGDAISIIKTPRDLGVSQTAALGRFEPYLAIVQARVTEALCKTDEAKPDEGEIMMSFWLDRSGRVFSAQLWNPELSADRQRVLLAGLQGLDVGQAVPAGLPQPLAMVIFPPSSREHAGCRPTSRRQAIN
ncbi:STN domain-containing protein [Bradyrhizobium sp. BRP22]|uniref:STN domain-containing protein n=1 Tax=Bradyrhizobium sp. BRP22 TaxID=2793821 RepID=UPI001CD1BDEB|nr:STN domain-containing protein [Bradyrhizobium sp. BRP22]MCA1454171.1 STN domain-containing protein [Bradyrhizobium sp. BRP22]